MATKRYSAHLQNSQLNPAYEVNNTKPTLTLSTPYLSSGLSLTAGLNLKLIIPVGRLAIDAFYAPSKTLEEIIGVQMEYASAHVIPLPHPSGVSR
ncbi:MAG: hypothetical protein R6U57_10545 [Anaerolineales bacterium]